MPIDRRTAGSIESTKRQVATTVANFQDLQRKKLALVECIERAAFFLTVVLGVGMLALLSAGYSILGIIALIMGLGTCSDFLTKRAFLSKLP